MLVETWHCSHEHLIRYLQDHPSSSSIEPLRKAIELKPQLEYLSYDDYGAYYKKCLWALAVDPSPLAIEEIRKYTESDDEILQEQARYRLEKLT